jgi:protein involved in ribonucleotide reduction
MERIYYDSRTGNVERFIQKLQGMTGWEFLKIQEEQPVFEAGHLITYTTRFGEVPDSTKRFLLHSSSMIKSISSSGNRNWGRNFALAADIISMEYGIPITLKFELSGTPEDINLFIQLLEEQNYGKERTREELDSAQ